MAVLLSVTETLPMEWAWQGIKSSFMVSNSSKTLQNQHTEQTTAVLLGVLCLGSVGLCSLCLGLVFIHVGGVLLSSCAVALIIGITLEVLVRSVLAATLQRNRNRSRIDRS
jgi:uncharacterized membrane protein